MKKTMVLAFLLAVAAGCATGGGVEKRFTVLVDPPDAQITVNAGGGQAEQKYSSSPADIRVSIPNDPSEAAKGRVVVSRQDYKPVAISLNSIHGETIRLKLDKALYYGLKFRMMTPVTSDDFNYRDKIVAIRLVPGERAFQLKIENLSQKPLSLLWEKSEYTDYFHQSHRIIRSTVKPQDRLKAVPSQTIPAGGTLLESFFPVDNVTYSQAKNAYESKPLFSLDDDRALALKGRSFSVFLPLEMDGGIIPDYNFRFTIVDVVKE